MNIVIFGCGVVGTLAGEILTRLGHAVVGVRRSLGSASFQMLRGDFAELDVHERLRGIAVWDAILIAANPGIRRGRDNRLREGAGLVRELYRRARVVYTGTTSVYADAQGRSVDEHGALATDSAAQALLAIEIEVIRHPHALILRAPALVGPSRTAILEKLHPGTVTIRGPVERPFSFIHEQDMAELCVEALSGKFDAGVFNASSPHGLTIGDYYRLLAQRVGVTCSFSGDSTHLPSRRIDSSRLLALCPGRVWRHVND
jgi:nucleoside-diphosphate-sugar epimerase